MINTASNYTEQLWAPLFPLFAVAEIVTQNIEEQAQVTYAVKFFLSG